MLYRAADVLFSSSVGRDGILCEIHVRESDSEGKYRAAALDNIRKLMRFMSIKVCKPILLVTQNEIMHLKMNIICYNHDIFPAVSILLPGFNCCGSISVPTKCPAVYESLLTV